MAYTEFVSADALIRSVGKTQQKLNISDEERPVAIQIYALVFTTDRQVEIIVGDNAIARRMAAGQDRRMAGAGFGRAMRLITRGKDSARREPRKAAGELAAIFGEQVGRQLVDRDHHDQLGRWRRGGHFGDRRGRILRENAAAADAEGGGQSDFQDSASRAASPLHKGVSAGCPLGETRLNGKPRETGV